MVIEEYFIASLDALETLWFRDARPRVPDNILVTKMAAYPWLFRANHSVKMVKPFE